MSKRFYRLHVHVLPTKNSAMTQVKARQPFHFMSSLKLYYPG